MIQNVDGSPDRRGVAPGGRPSAPAPLPRWARAADFVALVFLLLAAVVALSGGFRTRIADILITFTSPTRLVAVALAVAIARHYFVPAPPAHAHLAATFRRWWAAPGVPVAVAVLVFTRPAIAFVGYLGVFLFGFPQGQAPMRLSPNEFFNLPVRWDAGWYLQIATEGYKYVPGPAELQQNIVFFPAYPALVKIVGLLFGSHELPYVLAGVVVSLAAFAGALIYVYALARDFVTDDQARYALWLVGAYPFALFFGAIYTESLFLLAAAGAIYHFRRADWRWSAAWGLVAGLTRPNGCFLSIVLAVFAIAPALPAALAGGPRRAAVRDGARTGNGRWSDWRAWATAAAPGIGVLLYCAWVWHLTGDPIAWAEGHQAWGREYRGLSAVVSDRYKFIGSAGFYGYVAQLPHDFLNALGLVFVLAAAWPVYRRLGLAFAVFILINILPPLADGGLLSAGRFSSVLFPAFIWFAAVVPERHRAGWIASFAAVQALDAILFYTWRPLF